MDTTDGVGRLLAASYYESSLARLAETFIHLFILSAPVLCSTAHLCSSRGVKGNGILGLCLGPRVPPAKQALRHPRIPFP